MMTTGVLIKQIKWLYNEFGVASVYATGLDAWLIIFARSTRMFAYGANSLIIALFFSSLGFSDFYIGLFMSLTLVGDVLLSLLLTLVADKVGRRLILFLGSLLMVLSGLTFALSENYWILLAAAVVGVISATGSDLGPFRAIEESTLSHLTSPKTRADVLSWYVTSASLGSAIGTEVSGRVVHFLQGRDGWDLTDAYHAVFGVYVVTGLLNMVLMALMSSKCEAADKPPEPKTEASETLLNEMGSRRSTDDDGDNADDQGLDPSTSAVEEAPKEKKQSLFAQISAETRSVMYKLWFLLMIDTLADGMVGYSLTIYYMDQKFHLPKSTLGDITSISYFLSSCSTIFAPGLVRRLGLINTMVFTHLPSSTAVLLFPAPRGVAMTVILFFVRTALNNMDQAPRAAFIAAVVKPEERTAVMGVTSMLRTLASTAGPGVTGILAGHGRFWIAFVAAGALRIAYDLGLFAMFVNMKLYKHEEKQGIGMERNGSSTRREPEDGEELREV